MREDYRGLSATQALLAISAWTKSTGKEHGPPALRRASHDAPRRGPGALRSGQNRVLAPAGTIRVAVASRKNRARVLVRRARIDPNALARGLQCRCWSWLSALVSRAPAVTS